MCIYSLALLKRNTPRDYILKRDAQYAEYMHLWGGGTCIGERNTEYGH